MKSFNTEHNPSAVESGDASGNIFDDDGRERRTGTFMTASAHIITAVIGSGVLSLSWAIAQLGWVAGTVILVTFAIINYYTSTMLADCYRSPDAVPGTRNYTYMDVVRAYLGGRKVQLCGLAQYGSLVGVTIGYTIIASISLVAIGKANCFHDKGQDAKCSLSNYHYKKTVALRRKFAREAIPRKTARALQVICYEWTCVAIPSQLLRGKASSQICEALTINLREIFTPSQITRTYLANLYPKP
ncbi:unnamed protein product [Arabidopsis halleri]